MDEAERIAGTPASFVAYAARIVPATFVIHCLVRSREGWMIQARQTTASAPRRSGARSSVTTSAEAHSTFSTFRFGSLRATPRTDSTCGSIESERSTLVPTLPLAPTTTTLMLRALPRPASGETPRTACCTIARNVYGEAEIMRVLVTGARGKVGRATVAALQEAGH